MTGTIWPDVQQGSDEWFRIRCGRPTASQFSRIFTAGGKDSAQRGDYMVELAAASIFPDEPPAWSGSWDTDRGLERERVARDLFSDLTGLEVRTVGFVTRSPDNVLGASPDGIVYDGDQPVAGLEIKSPRAKKHLATLMEGKMPNEHRPQVHGNMICTGLPAWWFISYCPRMVPFITRIERDDYTARLEDALERFLIDYAAIRKRIVAPATGAGWDQHQLERLLEAWNREGSA